MQKVTLKVSGMTCNHCKMAVEKALRGLDGVSEAAVNLEEGLAVVDYEPGKVTLPQMQTAIQEAGYQVVEYY